MIKSIDQLYHWDSFLTQEEYNAVWEEFEHYNWTLSGFADKPEDDVQRKFWYKELSGAGYTRSLFKIKTEQFLNNKIITERLYGNGQAHSQSGWIHRDIEKDQRGEFGTLVYYLHKNWKPVYGGNIYFWQVGGSNEETAKQCGYNNWAEYKEAKFKCKTEI